MLKRSTIVGIEAIGSTSAALLLCSVGSSAVRVACDGKATVKALQSCFPDFLSHGRINESEVIGQEIFWQYDDSGTMLGGFVPVAEASGEVWEQYALQEALGIAV